MEEKLKMFERALKDLIESMKEKEGIPTEILERIDRVERKVDLLIRILTEWLPAKFLEEMKTLGITSTSASAPTAPMTPPKPATKPSAPATVESSPPSESAIPKPVDILSEEIELLKEELSTIERQIADLEFQKDSGFITTAEYEKKKRELEAKKKEIEARIKGK
ncbi:MAG: hypothetical protein Q6368_008110 [Candidatus Baldrarchaeota archaeon]